MQHTRGVREAEEAGSAAASRAGLHTLLAPGFASQPHRRKACSTCTSHHEGGEAALAQALDDPVSVLQLHAAQLHRCKNGRAGREGSASFALNTPVLHPQPGNATWTQAAPRPPVPAPPHLDVGARGDVCAAVLAVRRDTVAQEAQLLGRQLSVGHLLLGGGNQLGNMTAWRCGAGSRALARKRAK